MPNHVTNRLEINGTKEQIAKVLAYIKGEKENHFIDFNKVIPSPKNMFNGNIGREEEKHCDENNIPRWNNWCPANWGTKWNSYENELKYNVILFQTAWNGVPKIIDKLASIFQDVSFEYKYASEDTGYCVGNIKYSKGVIDSEEIEGGSNRAYEVCFELRPDNEEYYHKINGVWEYNEDAE